MMMQSNLVHEGERLDELQRNGYGIIQNPARFCFGMDAVLLSGFAKAKAGEKVLDLGTGTGIIPILMEAKTDAADFTALEIQEESADMARRSVAYNHLEDKIKVITGDIRGCFKYVWSIFFSRHHNKPAVYDRHSWGKLAIHSKSDRTARGFVHAG